MDLNGDIVPGAEKYAELDKPLLMKIYQTMVQT